jgi:hypothetical protein
MNVLSFFSLSLSVFVRCSDMSLCGAGWRSQLRKNRTSSDSTLPGAFIMDQSNMSKQQQRQRRMQRHANVVFSFDSTVSEKYARRQSCRGSHRYSTAAAAGSLRTNTAVVSGDTEMSHWLRALNLTVPTGPPCPPLTMLPPCIPPAIAGYLNVRKLPSE